uniref:Uncharacterized protein n=1 Tax=Triticum urartu TaxID=4572 RepID=A0A8R7TTB2_TRIUA
GRHHGCSGVLLEEKEGGRGRGREKTGRKERNEGRHGLPGGDGRGRGRSGALLVQGGQLLISCGGHAGEDGERIESGHSPREATYIF